MGEITKTSFNQLYFEGKFEKIPEEQWTTGNYTDKEKKCALGHCGELDSEHPTDESLALEKIFQTKNLRVSLVNDGESPQFLQSSPKQRILAALKQF